MIQAAAAVQGAGAGRLLRIGVFGGAFDPPHTAHLALARAAVEQLSLDELRVIPTGNAWHKARSLSPAAHRLKMCELAFAGLPKVLIDDREIRRSGPSYTIDTLEALRKEQPDSEFFLLIGGDQWASFSSWHRWQDILALASLAVVERPSSAHAPAAIQVSASWPPSAEAVRLQVPAMPISATAIRQKLSFYSAHTSVQARAWAADPELASVLPESVARYISLHGLYQARPFP